MKFPWIPFLRKKRIEDPFEYKRKNPYPANHWHEESIKFETYLRSLGNSYVYINVVGPFSAGKTQFIETISESDIFSIERHVQYAPLLRQKNTPLPNMGYDVGHISTEDHSHLFFFGTPGSRRIGLGGSFAFDEADLDGKWLGTIFLIDSARPETFRDAKSLLGEFRTYQPVRPYVVVANKQDHPDAWDLDDFEIALRKMPDERFIACSGFDKESVKQVVLELLYLARDSFET